ncbi:acyl-CoA dehydrogenase [Actinomadura madurae]|uniref:acyl-CoA dehydrogenase n=1 Tax=Actinomadura madurae TaxID=1993 RepID=UPI0020260AA9|nr:acyl-CoA dehydrogenase [Actinomadura madurae]URN07207.1 acyl-CoA dehydrogenase [Actinomadura madurae]
MPAPVLSRRDLEFLLYEWLDVTSLTARDRFREHSRETFDALLDLSADMAMRHFAPHNRLSDTHEPVMRPDGTVQMIEDVTTALRLYFEAGLAATQFDERYGGLQAPSVIARASMAWFQAANASTSAYPLLTTANAATLIAHGTAEQVERWVPSMLEGRCLGTMCLSEPEAGSSLADITTRATRQEDGTYRLTGTKMWISGGDHDLAENILHLVLAKIPGGGVGVRGISLFAVPKYLPDGTRNDITLVGLNHKMGMRGTTNTLLAFGDGGHPVGGRPGAVGYLVGEEHHGLTHMFHMMNDARIGIGFLATAIGYAGYLASLDYAKVRRQGRLPADKGTTAPPVALVEHADVRRMLLAQKSYVEGALALSLYCARLVDEQQTAVHQDGRERAALLLDVLTPVAKSWPSQWCLEANDLAIQIHGGYGYARDSIVEQLYRDNRLNPIHEGTHGIQGLDLLGRKVRMHDGAGLEVLVSTISRTVQRAERADADLAEFTTALRSAAERLTDVTKTLWALGDVTVTLANSSVYLEAAGHVVIAWMWLEQLLALGDRQGEFYDGKRQAARYFFRYELPKTSAQFDLLARGDRTTLDTHPEWL